MSEPPPILVSIIIIRAQPFTNLLIELSLQTDFIQKNSDFICMSFNIVKVTTILKIFTQMMCEWQKMLCSYFSLPLINLSAMLFGAKAREKTRMELIPSQTIFYKKKDIKKKYRCE